MENQEVINMLRIANSDMDWFNSNLKALKSKYDNQFIAFHNQKVIDADKNIVELHKRIAKQGKDTSRVITMFISKTKMILCNSEYH